jgi:hypothetical protein
MSSSAFPDDPNINTSESSSINIRPVLLPIIFIFSLIFALRQRLTTRAKFPVVGRDVNARIFGLLRAKAWCWWDTREALILGWEKVRTILFPVHLRLVSGMVRLLSMGFVKEQE